MSDDYPNPPYRQSQTPFPVLSRAPGVRRIATAAAAIIAVIVFAPSALPVTGPNASHPIEWDGQSFSGSADLAAWLRTRGVAYETWARRHSAAAARLEAMDRVGASGTNGWSSTSGKAALVLFVLALSLLLVPIVPRSIFARAQAEAVWERRLDLATVGLAVAVGLAVVLIL